MKSSILCAIWGSTLWWKWHCVTHKWLTDTIRSSYIFFIYLRKVWNTPVAMDVSHYSTVSRLLWWEDTQIWHFGRYLRVNIGRKGTIEIQVAGRCCQKFIPSLLCIKGKLLNTPKATNIPHYSTSYHWGDERGPEVLYFLVCNLIVHIRGKEHDVGPYMANRWCCNILPALLCI